MEKENQIVKNECKNNIDFLEEEKNLNLDLQNQIDEMNFKFSEMMKLCKNIKNIKENYYISSGNILRNLNNFYK
jgi:hypothetical protein